MTPDSHHALGYGDVYDRLSALELHVGALENMIGAAPPPSRPVNVDAPYCGGSGIVGEPLTCTMGNWENEPVSYQYQWKQDVGDGPVAIPGETASAYTPTPQDAGSSILCTLIAINAVGWSPPVSSNSVTIAGAKI